MTLNAAHIHLMVNHYAIFATFFGVALAIAGMVRDVRSLRLASYILFVTAGLAVIVTYVSGTLAEDAVEHVAGVLERAIDPHEEAGKVSLVLVIATALASIYALLVDRRSDVKRYVPIVVIALGTVAFLASGYTALLGGYIHHPEIRSGSVAGSGQSE